ncbi:shikimate kinase [Cellulomonas sp. NPDC089187]|uniref:shikimate kinase n=1 Tax=Cellulomonas sp. NPDC089187 TaxID=3154970 RepID=UPI003426F904
MPPALVLIGPAGTGKSTVGAAVAAALDVPFWDADEHGEQFYAEQGWTLDRLRDRITTVGRLAAEYEWEPARAHAVTALVDAADGGVLALGAGHTTYTQAAHRATVQAALATAPHVVMLLPHKDADLGLPVLRERCRADKGTEWVRDGHDFLAQWWADPHPRRWATDLVITGDEGPAATAERVLALVDPARPGRRA